MQDAKTFTVFLQEVDAWSGGPKNTDLHLQVVYDPGDKGEPVVTIGPQEDFDYAIRSLRQAIDFAEIEHNFIPLCMWADEVNHSDNAN
jgi:hypothetical protein